MRNNFLPSISFLLLVTVVVLGIGCQVSDLPPDPSSINAPIGQVLGYADEYASFSDGMFDGVQISKISNDQVVLTSGQTTYTTTILSESLATHKDFYIYNPGQLSWNAYEFEAGADGERVANTDWFINGAEKELTLPTNLAINGKTYMAEFLCNRDASNNWDCGEDCNPCFTLNVIETERLAPRLCFEEGYTLVSVEGPRNIYSELGVSIPSFAPYPLAFDDNGPENTGIIANIILPPYPNSERDFNGAPFALSVSADEGIDPPKSVRFYEDDGYSFEITLTAVDEGAETAEVTYREYDAIGDLAFEAKDVTLTKDTYNEDIDVVLLRTDSDIAFLVLPSLDFYRVMHLPQDQPVTFPVTNGDNIVLKAEVDIETDVDGDLQVHYVQGEIDEFMGSSINDKVVTLQTYEGGLLVVAPLDAVDNKFGGKVFDIRRYDDGDEYDCRVSVVRCGDGYVDELEECDDGNLRDGDGCSSVCEDQEVTDPICGDNICSPSESCSSCVEDCGCDDGYCYAGSCIGQNACGDGLCDPSESCSSCTEDCGCTDGSFCYGGTCVGGPSSYCGDSIIDEEEECDGADDCSVNCKLVVSWPVATATNKLELSENRDDGIVYSENIKDVKGSIDETDFAILKSGTAFNLAGYSEFTQTLIFDNNVGEYVILKENNNDKLTDFFYIPNGQQIARYVLSFASPYFQMGFDAQGRLSDFDPESPINILGKDYAIVEGTRLAQNSIMLNLMAGDTINLAAGESYNFPGYIPGEGWDVVATQIDGINFQVRLTVNGELTSFLEKGDLYTLNDGRRIGIKYLQTFGDPDRVAIVLDAYQIILKDSDVTDSTFTNTLEVNSENIDDVYVIMEGSDDGSDSTIQSITLDIKADDDYFVPAKSTLSKQMQEPQALLDSWDIEYRGLDKDVGTEITVIRSVGDNSYIMETYDGGSNLVRIPLAIANNPDSLALGEVSSSLVINEGTTIKKNDHFILTDSLADPGRRKSYVLQYKGTDTSIPSFPKIKFEELGAGELREFVYTVDGDEATATISLGGVWFTLKSASDITQDDFDIRMNLDGDVTIEDDQQVSFTTPFGAEISFTDNTPTDIGVKISTVNPEDWQDLQPADIAFTITVDLGKVSLADDPIASPINYQLFPTDDNFQIAYTSLGTQIEYLNPPGFPEIASITYPSAQRFANVFLTSSNLLTVDESEPPTPE